MVDRFLDEFTSLCGCGFAFAFVPLGPFDGEFGDADVVRGFSGMSVSFQRWTAKKRATVKPVAQGNVQGVYQLASQSRKARRVSAWSELDSR
jgi:hypothetical protein